MSSLTFIHPDTSYSLPQTFDFEDYIETERELWAFFPETAGKRVNFCQLGLSARLFSEMTETGQPLSADETYFLMPCQDATLRPVRMKSERILTLDEFRMSLLTSIRITSKLEGTTGVMEEVHREVLGPELVAETLAQF